MCRCALALLLCCFALAAAWLGACLVAERDDHFVRTVHHRRRLRIFLVVAILLARALRVLKVDRHSQLVLVVWHRHHALESGRRQLERVGAFGALDFDLRAAAATHTQPKGTAYSGVYVCVSEEEDGGGGLRLLLRVCVFQRERERDPRA